MLSFVADGTDEMGQESNQVSYAEEQIGEGCFRNGKSKETIKSTRGIKFLNATRRRAKPNHSGNSIQLGRSAPAIRDFEDERSKMHQHF